VNRASQLIGFANDEVLQARFRPDLWRRPVGRLQLHGSQVDGAAVTLRLPLAPGPWTA
jgi:hypothetical protein